MKKIKNNLVIAGFLIFLLLIGMGFWFAYVNNGGNPIPLVLSAILNALYAFEGHDEWATSLPWSKHAWLYGINFLLAIAALGITSFAVLSAFRTANSKLKLWWWRSRLNPKKKVRSYYFLEFDEENRNAAETLIQNSKKEKINGKEREIVFLYADENDFKLDKPKDYKNRILKFSDSSISEENYISKVEFTANNVTVISPEGDEKLVYSKPSLAVRNLLLNEIDIYKTMLSTGIAPKVLIIGRYDLLFEELFTQLCVFLQSPLPELPHFTLVIDSDEQHYSSHIEAMFPALIDLKLVEIESLKSYKDIEIVNYDLAFICNTDELRKRASLSYLIRAQKKKEADKLKIYIYDDTTTDMLQEFEEDSKAYVNFGNPEHLYNTNILKDILDENPLKVDWLYSHWHETLEKSDYNLKEAKERWKKLSSFLKASNRSVSSFINNYWLLSEPENQKKYDKKAERFAGEITEYDRKFVKPEYTYIARVEHKRWCAFQAVNGYTKMKLDKMQDRFSEVPADYFKDSPEEHIYRSFQTLLDEIIKGRKKNTKIDDKQKVKAPKDDEGYIIVVKKELEKENISIELKNSFQKFVDDLKEEYEEDILKKLLKSVISTAGKYARTDEVTLKHICQVPWEKLPDVSEAYSSLSGFINEDYQKADFYVMHIAEEVRGCDKGDV